MNSRTTFRAIKETRALRAEVVATGGLKVSTYKMQDQEIKAIDVAFYFDQPFQEPAN